MYLFKAVEECCQKSKPFSKLMQISQIHHLGGLTGVQRLMVYMFILLKISTLLFVREIPYAGLIKSQELEIKYEKQKS